MYICRHPFLRIATLLPLAFILLSMDPLSASEFSPVKQKSLDPFEPVYSETSRGLGFQMIGESLLEGPNRKSTSRLPLKLSGSVKKAFLLWSGEVDEQNPNAEKIHFLGSKGQEHTVSAQRIWKKNSTGILYSALADVTRYVPGNGRYGASRLASDEVNPGGKDPYSVAGWALLVITENRKSDNVSSVTLLAGLAMLKPGETYNYSLTPHLPKGFIEPETIGIIGGHGRAGNGSGNLLNSKALSGRDDWDSSAGKFWDIDLFQVTPDNKSVANKGEMALTMDPLLQWIYPVGVIIKLRMPANKEK